MSKKKKKKAKKHFYRNAARALRRFATRRLVLHARARTKRPCVVSR